MPRLAGVASMECPGPDSNRHAAFRRRWILSPLCLPVSPPGQRDHCNGGAWVRGGDEIERIGGNDLSAALRLATTGIRTRLGRHGGRLAAACPEFGHLDISSADAHRRLRIRAEAG